MSTPGYGSWKRIYKEDGTVVHKCGSVITENPPVLSHPLLADLRVLEHTIGLIELSRRTGYSIQALSSLIHNDRSLGGLLPQDKYDNIITARTEVYRNNNVDEIENMRLNFTTHSLFRCKSRKLQDQQEGIQCKYIPPETSVRIVQEAERSSSNSLINRPSGNVRHVLTEPIQNRLKLKLRNLGSYKLLASKCGYCARNMRKLLKPNKIGTTLDPVKGVKLYSYASNNEDA